MFKRKLSFDNQATAKKQQMDNYQQTKHTNFYFKIDDKCFYTTKNEIAARSGVWGRLMDEDSYDCLDYTGIENVDNFKNLLDTIFIADPTKCLQLDINNYRTILELAHKYEVMIVYNRCKKFIIDNKISNIELIEYFCNIKDEKMWTVLAMSLVNNSAKLALSDFNSTAVKEYVFDLQDRLRLENIKLLNYRKFGGPNIW